MKILLKAYNGQYYVWKDAKYEGGEYVLTDNGDSFYETDILDVKEDERIGFVQCGHCGELIKDDPESIEAHFVEIEAKKDCLTCPSMVIYTDKQNHNRTIVKNENGTYAVSETYDTYLGCRVNYYTENIDSAAAKRNCVYAQCRRKGARQINDAFVKYPHLFDKQITVDVLNEKKFQFETYSNGHYVYDLKMRGTLKACVDINGVVDYFILYVNGWAHNVYYSARYNKLFMYDWNRYKDDLSSTLTESREARIISKISKLYQEETTNG